MRIVVDLQGAQTDNRSRRTGRYSLALSQALARKAQNHDLWIALNSRFEDTIAQVSAAFESLVPQDHIVLFDIPGPVAESDPNNGWRARAAELVREHFLATLKGDVTYTSSIFEGFVDDAATSIGLLGTVGCSAVTVYDRVPFVGGDNGFSNERIQAWYYRKLASLQRSDILLTLSEAFRKEIIREWNVPEEMVINIGIAADKRFRKIEMGLEEAQRLRSMCGLSRSFVLYNGGFEPDSNLERLVEAFSLLPGQLQGRYQLLLVGDLPDGESGRLLNKAARFGLTRDGLRFAGNMNDEDIVQLYNLCDLFVYPSLHADFGLAALEAMSCGAPVISSDRSSVPEIMDRSDSLFDPAKSDSIAEKMASVIANPGFAESLRSHGMERAKRFTWEESSDRMLAAFEEKYAQRQYSSGSISTVNRSRPRLAFICPLPPERTGIADYSAELIPELTRYYDIDVVTDQREVSDPWVCANFPIRSPEWFDGNAEKFQSILYHIGNSPFHRYQFDLLERRPGTIVLHDFFLSSVLEYLEWKKVIPNAFRKALYASHGYASLAETKRHPFDAKYSFSANKEVLDHAAGVIVHSEFARQLGAACYGAQYVKDWRVIPSLRSVAGLQDRTEARTRLGISASDFLVCSFGHIQSTKLSLRLLDSWITSPLNQDQRCHLVFVGHNNEDKYGAEILKRIQSTGGSKKRIHITGWVSTELFQVYLSAADAAVQLRTLSRGETSRAVLDCLAFGIPTIVNAHGTAAELPDDVVIKIPDEFDNKELCLALERLRHDEAYREELSRRAVNHVRTVHAPARVAEMYCDAIEHFAGTAFRSCERRCFAQIKRLSEGASPSDEDILKTAECLANARERTGPPQLIIDVSTIARNDLKTGIERVTRGVLQELLLRPPDGFRIEPVYFDFEVGQYRFARKFTLRFLGLDDSWAEDEILDAGHGDLFLGLDWTPNVVPVAESVLRKMGHRGVRIFFIVHDLLPIVRPQSFPRGVDDIMASWLGTVARVSDGVVCVSDATAADLARWLDLNPPLRRRSLAIGISHNGADIEASAPSMGLPKQSERILSQCRVRQSFLMVGTIEPRKRHAQVVEAFERLWSEGMELNLVIIGKPGWMVESLIERLRSHREADNRLFYMEWVSDEMLLRLYEESAALIMASEGEGFGLPLIEAAHHKLPIIARDLPVFKEVAGEYAYYFHGTEPDDLAKAIRDWIKLRQEGSVPDSSEMPWLTWQQSTATLLNLILGGKWGSVWMPKTQN